MESTKKLIVIACVVAIMAGGVSAQDWPQWRGPHRDGKVDGFAAPSSWPQALVLHWTKTVGLGDATPALVDGRLYVFARQGGDEVAYCFTADDGELVWKDSYATEPASGPSGRDHAGSRSSPAVADGKVVTFGVGGVLSCLDCDAGNVQWRHDPFPNVVPKFFTAFSPIVVDGLVVAHFGKEGEGAVIAYDVNSGQETWRWSGDGPTYASPVLMTVGGVKQLVMHTENNLVSLAVSDGALLWKEAIPPRRRFYSSVTPIVDGQTIIYTGQGTGTRAIKVDKQGDTFKISELWANDEVGGGYNTPVLKDGLLFGISDPSNYVYCLDGRNGRTKWIDTTRYGRFGTMVNAGSVLLALPVSELIVLKPNGDAYRELARYKVAEGQVYAYPVVANRAIYVKDEKSLTKWVIE